MIQLKKWQLINVSAELCRKQKHKTQWSKQSNLVQKVPFQILNKEKRRQCWLNGIKKYFVAITHERFKQHYHSCSK